METIKINFGYFWPTFNKQDNFYAKVLSTKYHIEISDQPDFYFFTHPYDGKRDYLKYKCHRIFFGFENQRADWNIADYVVDFDFITDNSRHKRFPMWAMYNMSQLMTPKEPTLFARKEKFCCMLVSNANAKERIDFFHQLSKYKKVDSGGRYLNNIGRSVDDKMDFIKDYKFVISFENSAYPGYTTEKLIEPMMMNSIPVYWGNPLVGEDFNTRSFINVNEFTSYEEAIKCIIELDTDDEKYMTMVNEPWFKNNKIPEEFSNENLLGFFEFIIKDSKTRRPVATSITKDYMHRLLLFKNRLKGSLYHRLRIGKGVK